jgi:hypothetical protein
VAVVYSWAIAAVIPVIIDAHAIAIRCRGRIGYGPYRSRWRKAITVEQHPRSSAIGTAVPTTAVVSVKDTDVPVVGVRAVAVGVIEVAITDCPMPRRNAQISSISGCDRNRGALAL